MIVFDVAALVVPTAVMAGTVWVAWACWSDRNNDRAVRQVRWLRDNLRRLRL